MADRLGDDESKKTERRGGGGKLARSETVTVRLDPKIRYLAELAARKQRRTLSSFIEWAIEENLKNIHLADDHSKSLANESAELWDVDEPDRFVQLARRYPEMLTHDEQVLWKLLREYEYVRSTRGGSEIRVGVLREHWPNLKKVAQGELPKSTLTHLDE